MFGQPRTIAHYNNGQKDGTWIQIAESGDTLHITTYNNGNEEGLQVRFDRATGSRVKEFYKRITVMTDFIENTTLKLENLFMRQPTSSDVLTVKQIIGTR